MPIQSVIDINVLISALLSRRGASFRLISSIGQSLQFALNVSVPLVLEYENVANRFLEVTGLSSSDVEDIIDYICSQASLRRIFFLWRPFLKYPKDDMVLELAVESQSEIIVSFNKKDFVGADQFGIRVLTPREFLEKNWRNLMSILSLRIPESLHKQARELAKSEGISINQLVACALGEKMAALMTQDYLEQRAQNGDRNAFQAALAKVKDVEPEDARDVL